MKNTLKFFILIISLLCSSLLFSQNKKSLNGFKYAIVYPLIYNNNQRDIFGIESSAIQGLQNIGIECLDNTNKNNWADDAKVEPCMVIFISVSVENPPNSFNCGSIRIVGRDCKNKVVFDEVKKGRNAICSYPYECCYSKLAYAAQDFFKNFEYSYDADLNNLKTEVPEVETLFESEDSLKLYFNKNDLDLIEGIYKSTSSPDLPFYKIAIKKYKDIFKAIVLESNSKLWKPGQVKAIFESSSIQNVYSTKWYMQDKSSIETFSKIENQTILSIEFKNANSSQSGINKFIKIYPQNIKSGIDKENEPITKSTGSGFLLTSNGYIATNAHVTKNAKKLSISLFNDTGTSKYNAKIILSDEINDVAILQIDDSKFNGLTNIPYTLNENAEVGEKVYTIGYPLNDIMGNNYKLTDGIISSKSGIGDDIRYFQISVPLQPGNSGGPLFNNQGNVIGFIFWEFFYLFQKIIFFCRLVFGIF
jgi:S1-C subfamily serine protease